MGMGEFNSDDHYIYYWGQNYHRRNGVAHIINKIFQNAVIGCKLKNYRKWQTTPALLPGKSCGQRSLIGYSPWGRKESDTTKLLASYLKTTKEKKRKICLFPRQTKLTAIQVCDITTDTKETEVDQCYEDLEDLLRTKTKKRHRINLRRLKCNSRKSGDDWSNRQVWFWSTKRSRAKAKRVLSREHISHSKHPFPKIPEMTLHTDITKWSMFKSDWLCFLHSLGKTLLAFALLHFVLQGQTCLLLQVTLDFLLLHSSPIWWKSEVTQSCPTLCDPMGYSLPCSSVHGIF